MKNFYKNSIVVITTIVVAFALVFTGASTTLAATTPSLGLADTFSVLASTFTRNVGTTAINGDAGYTTLSGSGTSAISGTTHVGDATYTQAGIDQGTALTNLNGQACTFTFPAGAVDLATDTTHGPIGVYTPGVYCTTAGSAASIGTAGITLSGSGTYIFRINGAFTTVNNSHVTLSGASSCDVFWTPTSATTLGANTSFVGTVIDNSGITIGNNTLWSGRALDFATTVTTDTNTITSACTFSSPTLPSSIPSTDGLINVVKVVINDNGGTKIVSDFPLIVSGRSVVSGQTNSFRAPGTYFVSEITDPNYTTTFSGDCDSDGRIGIISNSNRICIITNNDKGVSSVPPVPPLVDVLKVPSPLALPAGPGPVTYTYTLRNIGTVPVTNLTMVDDSCSVTTLISGDTNFDGKLSLSEVWTYRCTTTLSATHTNTVVATGWANGISAVDIASATVVVGTSIVSPLIHVTKTPSVFALGAGGGVVTYTEKITNPGVVPLSAVRISDDKCSPVIYMYGDANANTMLDVNETWVYNCFSNLTQTTTNTAIAEGVANGITVRDFAIVTVTVGVPGLPQTGFPPQNNIFIIVVLSGVMLSLGAFYTMQQKKITKK